MSDELELQNRISRRKVIRLGWIVAGLIFFGSQLWILLKLLLSPKASGGFGDAITVGPAERYAVGSVTHFWKERFLLVRQPDGFFAFSHQCTHNKCNVDFSPEQRIIICPCHSALFSLTGDVISGPAPRPLDRFAVTLRDGDIIVDTSRLLRSGS